MRQMIQLGTGWNLSQCPESQRGCCLTQLPPTMSSAYSLVAGDYVLMRYSAAVMKLVESTQVQCEIIMQHPHPLQLEELHQYPQFMIYHR